MEENKSKSSIGFGALVLMILSTIFGFANSTVAFDQMGYASIIWYILAAIFVFFTNEFDVCRIWFIIKGS